MVGRSGAGQDGGQGGGSGLDMYLRDVDVFITRPSSQFIFFRRRYFVTFGIFPLCLFLFIGLSPSLLFYT